MLAEIQAALTADTLEKEWADTLAHWEDATAVELHRTRAWVTRIRDEFFDHVTDVAEEEELIFAMALRYIELRSHWQMLNTQMNYQMFRKGTCSMELQMRGSLLSQLIEQIVPFVDAEDTNRIGELLLSPATVAS